MQKSRQFCHLPPVVARRTTQVLLVDFWYFWSCKSTIKEKFLYDTSLSEFFSLVRKEHYKKSFFMFLRGRTMFAPTIAGRRGITQCEALLGVAETGVAPSPKRQVKTSVSDKNKRRKQKKRAGFISRSQLLFSSIPEPFSVPHI